MAIVALNQLSCRFGSITAADGINLTVRDGEKLVLLGPSGSGKSTVLRIVAGLVDPTAGSVAIDGRVISSAHGSVPPERRGMAMLFHSTALWPHLSVFENVAFALKPRFSASGCTDRVATALAAVGLADHGPMRPQHLTAIDRQRVALARAIAVEPNVLLLDDAFGMLIPSERQVMAELVRTVAGARRMTTISVSNDPQEAMLLADRIAVFARGRLEQVDTPGNLYMHPATRVVALELGRALILEGQRTNKHITCAGLKLDAARVERGAGAEGVVKVCLRPEHVRLFAPEDQRPESWASTRGTIERRTFLGTHWAYEVMPKGASTLLHVAAPNTQVLPAGADVVIAVDPARVVVVR